MNTLKDPTVAAAIERMYAEASGQMAQLRDFDWQRLSSATARERADAFQRLLPAGDPRVRSAALRPGAMRRGPEHRLEFGNVVGLSRFTWPPRVRDNGADPSSPRS